MKKETILLYSILRNRVNKVQQFYDQVKMIVESFTNYDFYISIYENDSTDGTKEALQALDWSFAKDYSLICENIGTPYFGSVATEERVRILADARNKAIEAKDFLANSDYVLMIEGDMRFDYDCANKVLNFKNLYDVGNVDIVSASSWSDPNFSHWDTWGTRRNPTEDWGGLHPNWRDTEYDRYYATCNAFCLFKAEPFKQGARYGWFNERFNKFDCDTIVICEEFHKLGYHDVFVHHRANCWHF